MFETWQYVGLAKGINKRKKEVWVSVEIQSQADLQVSEAPNTKITDVKWGFRRDLL